jgi:hypothetical protein
MLMIIPRKDMVMKDMVMALKVSKLRRLGYKVRR